MRQHLPTTSSSWIRGSRLRGVLLRRIGFPLLRAGKMGFRTRLVGFISKVRRLSSVLYGNKRGGQPGEGRVRAEHLRQHSKMVIGHRCSISPRAVITDPDYVVMGDNVRLSDCHLFGHDGSINMINEACHTSYDAVGKIVIGDNVFIGHGAVVLPDTEIGSNVIIGAGAVVKGIIPSGFVYVGSPARSIRTFRSHVETMRQRQDGFSAEWQELLQERGSEFDPAFEDRLVSLRRQHFFGRSI